MLHALTFILNFQELREKSIILYILPCFVGGSWSILGWFIRRHQFMCHPCKTCNYYAKRHSVGASHSRWTCLKLSKERVNFYLWFYFIVYIEFTRHIQRPDFTFKLHFQLHFHLYKLSSKQSARSVSNRRSQLREKFRVKFCSKYFDAVKRPHFKEWTEGIPSALQCSNSTKKNYRKKYSKKFAWKSVFHLFFFTLEKFCLATSKI